MLIKQSDYHRIYRVIHSLLSANNADPATASMYFSTFGAFILEHHFKIKARPTGGLAAYNLDGALLLFADHRDDGFVTGAGENFHCWVEADGWAIDFMAPSFPQAAPALTVAPKMFQRPLSAMASGLNALGQSGDFFYQSETAAMSRRFAEWHSHAAIGDLASVAAGWFRKAPRQMPASLTLRDRDGKEKTVSLSGNMLSGSW